MPKFNLLVSLFIANAFLVQIVLLIHFAVRKWAFATAIRYGSLVYALSIPSALLSFWILLSGGVWWSWLAGFLFLAWAAYGFIVEYVLKIEWREPIRSSIFIPYIFLYLATIMFYWWPLIRIWRPLWFVYAVLFLASTVLNLSSHHNPEQVARTNQ